MLAILLGVDSAVSCENLVVSHHLVQASGESTVQKEPSEVPVTSQASQASQVTRSGFRHVLLNLFALPYQMMHVVICESYDASNGFGNSKFIDM